MFVLFWVCFYTVLRLFRSRRRLLLENLALRQQLLVLKRSVRKPRLRATDRFFWIVLRRFWSGWNKVLLLISPQTVVGWHPRGYRLFWRWKSRRFGGRPRVDHDLIALIRRMWNSNPTWGSRRIQAELAKLGLNASDSTIRKYRPKHRRSAQTWKSFLQNHADAIVAMDFFTIPTVTFRVLYVLAIMAHERRRIIYFNITDSPTAFWTAQQIVNAFPENTAPKYLLRDRDGIYGGAFVSRVQGLGIQEKLIAPRSPWQNPFVERLIGSIRRECLDHLQSILSRFTDYYQNHRLHRSLDQDSPLPRSIESPTHGRIIELPLLGGLHHRYTRRAA
jgi:transposase InsO family protein